MDRNFFVEIFGRRVGIQYSPIRFALTGERYMDRYILYTGFGTIRAHKFYRGDDLRAEHDHPFWFMTIPFRTYVEVISAPVTGLPMMNVVNAFSCHFRPAEYRHIVLGRIDGSSKPFWTFVISGPRKRSWGFWPEKDKFVPWREWK